MNWGALTASAVLAIIAAAGILGPFGRSRHIPLQQATNPLEEERASLLRALRRLDEDHAAGMIDDRDYAALRHETQVQAVAVLRELALHSDSDARGRQLRDFRGPSSRTNGGRQGASVGRRAIQFLLGIVLLSLASVALLAAVRARGMGEPATGNAASPAVVGSIGFFEQRVQEHPTDVGARLDLAQRYLEADDSRPAISQYESALSLDHRNAEALATLGYLVYFAGKQEVGLRLIDHALAIDHSFPEALYYKGVILLKGEGKAGVAARYLERYINAAPYGSHRAEVDRLLVAIGR